LIVSQEGTFTEYLCYKVVGFPDAVHQACSVDINYQYCWQWQRILHMVLW